MSITVTYTGDRRLDLADQSKFEAHQRRLALIAAPFPRIGPSARILPKTWAGTIVGDSFYGYTSGRDNARALPRMDEDVALL